MYKKVLGYLDQFEDYSVLVLYGAMVISVFIQILSRYVFKTSLPWTEELARYLMVWGVFIGASIAAREGAHIGITALVNKVPEKMKKVLVVVGAAITMIFMLLLCYFSIYVVQFLIDTGQKSPGLRLPMYISYAAIPVGTLLMSLRFTQLAIDKYKQTGVG